MSVEFINPGGLHEPVNGMYSHVAKATGRFMYRIGGQVAVDSGGDNIAVGDMAGQIQSSYELTTLALSALGLSWSNVMHVYTFTTDIDEYMRNEETVIRRFVGETPPPSTVIGVVRLVDPRWLLEVQVDAVGD